MLTAACSGMLGIVHLFFWTLSEISGLLAVFWDLNFYTGPKMERLERS